MPYVDEYVCPICGALAYGVYCYECDSFRSESPYDD